MKYKDLGLQKSFLQTVILNDPKYKNYYPLRKLFTDYLNKLNVPFSDICCPTANGNNLPVRYNPDGDLIEVFDGTNWIAAPTEGLLSDDTISTFLLSENSESEIEFDGPKMRDISHKNLISLYKMPVGNLTAEFDDMVPNGAMTTATIALQDGFDNVIVAGSNQDSYIRFPFIQTANRVITRMRVRVDAIGTTPLLGFRHIWPGSGFSNFNTSQYYGYFNLTTGAVTSTGSGFTTLSTYNGWTGTIAAGDIVEVELQSEFMQNRTFKISKIGDITTGQVSINRQIKTVSADGEAQMFYPAIIMADGTYTILDYEIMSLDNEPYFLIDGDSMGTGVRVSYDNSLVGKLNSKLPYRSACIASGTKLTTGDLATLWQIIKLKPTYVIVMRYLDALQGLSNPLNGGYATWHANFTRYISTLQALGITPIFVHPESWDGIANAANCQFYTDYLTTNYPNELNVFITTAESVYDSTGFHYAGSTNEIIVDKIIALLSNTL